MRKKTIRVASILIAVAVVVFLLLQALPIDGLTNPPVTSEPAWNSPETRALAKRACFDCHSNETVWPWYAHIAPVKWLVVHDVDEGRATFNFSDWHSGDMSGEAAADEIASGGMPLPHYLSMHSEARLTETEKQRLIAGLLATMPTPVPAATSAPVSTQTPASTQSSPATQIPMLTPTLDGAALLETRCSACHSADKATQIKQTRERWGQTVSEMIDKGAQLTEAEKAVLVDYLAKTYGP